ncbi:hypothetical protein KGM_201362 [Danaus plexippus plexippus]|uniref:Uncharacterized protein n=1 Tax=Danaus plexippus plexippus TaxID=278856 RepID=A0A212FHH5_DANPL|nr:hypothetical protein KGM_201362 [Danaus plexippus plexippus]
MEIKAVQFLVSLLAVTYHDLETPKSVNAKESDETALREALLLVELLKSGNYNPPQMWRRMDYENVFGPQPNATTSTSQATEKTTVSQAESSTVSSSTKPDISINVTTPLPSSISTSTKELDSQSLSTSKPPTSAKQNTVSSPTPPTTPSSAAPTTHKTILLTSRTNNKLKSTKALTIYKKKDTKASEPKKLHLNLEVITSPVPITDPEQAQVVSELEQELESEIAYSSSSLSPSSRWHITWRPTTRIHLAGSTRYPIPLPVNHAFCFTNPESPLCRTFIK